jgi:hypothetical protein
MILPRFMSFTYLAFLVSALCYGQAADQSVTSASSENHSASSSLAVTASGVDTSRQDATVLPPDLTGAIGSMISSRKDLQSGGSTSPTPSKGLLGRTGRAWLSTPLVNKAAESSLPKAIEATKLPISGETPSPDAASQGPSVSAEASSTSTQVAPGGGAKTGGSGSQKGWVESSHPMDFNPKVGVSKHASRPSPKKVLPAKKQGRPQAGALP